jgi:glucosamine-6-phosphate deaminase
MPNMAEMPQSLHRAGMTVEIFGDAATACEAAAGRIAEVIRSASSERGKAVLGLATGSTPEKIYANLAELHRRGELSFRDVVSYNLDEYYPISPVDPRSYRTYMDRHLFSKVDILPNRAHVLDGTVPETFVAEHTAEYDRWIDGDGGLDFQLLGIGRNGHIAFNEPSELSVENALKIPTHLARLHPTTIEDAAGDFGGIEKVIPRALTMGVASILAARSILIVALGPRKAEAVAQSLNGPPTPSVPASLLQTVASKVTWILDAPAAGGLG